MGLPRRGPRAGTETVRDRHARIPLLAARLGARARKAAVDETPSLRPMGSRARCCPRFRSRAKTSTRTTTGGPCASSATSIRRAGAWCTPATAWTSRRTSRGTPSSTACGRTSGTRPTSRSRRSTRPSAIWPRSSSPSPSRRSPPPSSERRAASRDARIWSRASRRSSARRSAAATATTPPCRGRCGTR